MLAQVKASKMLTQGLFDDQRKISDCTYES